MKLSSDEAIQARGSPSARAAILWCQRRSRLWVGVISIAAIALAWLSYALWGQNQDLRWEKMHPNELRPGTWFTKALSKDADLTFLLIVLQIIMLLPWAKTFYRRRRKRILSGKRVAGSLLLGYVVLALLGVGLSVYFGVLIIDYYRWDNQPARQAQRAAEFQKWQQMHQEHPDWPFTPPRTGGFSATALGFFLFMGLAGALASANLLRKIADEYLFVAFQSSEEEQLARFKAESEQEADLDFAHYSGKPKTLFLFSAICCCLGVGVVLTFVIATAKQQDFTDYLLIPVTFVFGWALSCSIAMGLKAPTKPWLWTRTLVALASVAALLFLNTHYDRMMTMFGLVCGGFCGVMHGIALGRQLKAHYAG